MKERLRVIDVVREDKPWWQICSREEFGQRVSASPFSDLLMLKNNMEAARQSMVAVGEDTSRDPDQRRRARYASHMTGAKIRLLQEALRRCNKEIKASNAAKTPSQKQKKRSLAVQRAREHAASGDLAAAVALLLDLIDPQIDWEAR